MPSELERDGFGRGGMAQRPRRHLHKDEDEVRHLRGTHEAGGAESRKNPEVGLRPRSSQGARFSVDIDGGIHVVLAVLDCVEEGVSVVRPLSARATRGRACTGNSWQPPARRPTWKP